MAIYTSKLAGFAIDSSTGSLTDISAYTTRAGMSNTIEQLDVTGLGDSLREYIDGLGDAPTVNVAGRLNSTTEPIFTPLAVVGTSVSNVKTIEVKLTTGVYRTSEATVESVEVVPGEVGQPGTWSATLRPTSSMTQTSVSAAS